MLFIYQPIMRVVAPDVRHLEAVICQIREYGDTRTSIIMSSPMT